MVRHVPGSRSRYAASDTLPAEETTLGIESGKTMRQDEVLFESAIEAIHADRPTSDQLSASADRVAERLGLDHGVHAPSSVLVTCEDVRRRFLSRDAGVVPDSPLRLIDAPPLSGRFGSNGRALVRSEDCPDRCVASSDIRLGTCHRGNVSACGSFCVSGLLAGSTGSSRRG